MAAQPWRRLFKTVVNGCIEGALALDPCAYEAFVRANTPDAFAERTAGMDGRGARTASGIAPQPARAALQLDRLAEA